MKQLIVNEKDSNQRIDKYIRKYLNNAPLSFIYKLFRTKKVKVNDKRVDIGYLIKKDDKVNIYVSDESLSDFSKPRILTKEKIDFEIIYEDENIMVVNKPSGLLLHEGNLPKSKTLNNQILNYLSMKGEYHEKDLFIPCAVHRLDRNTSGVVIVSKNLVSSQILFDLFKDKSEIEKSYLAVVCGQVKEKGEIKEKLAKDEKNNLVRVDNKLGLSAHTLYKPIKSNNNYSLLKIEIITGRTHQIRVHMAHIKHPILNDDKYGDFQINKTFKNKFDYDYQLLHAYSIKFKDISGHLSYLSNKGFKAKPSSDFLNILKEEFNYEL